MVDSRQYASTVYAAVSRFEAGDAAEARAMFERIVADPEVPDLDRCMMALNVANILSSSGAAEADIEAVYDRAIQFERPWLRGFAAESKAAWLAAVGRTWEARDMLQSLRQEPWLTFSERDRIDQSLAAMG